jgi:hypothetical protein
MTAPVIPGPDAATPLAWIVRRADVASQWLALGEGTHDPAAFVQRLVAAEEHVLAMKCVAVAVPVRQAVWWAWVAARHLQQVAPAPGLAAVHAQLLGLVERWISAPDDRTRRDAWAIAEALGLEHPATLAAAAAWFSGGSIAPADSPHAVPAPAGLAQNFVVAGVAIAATLADPANAQAAMSASIAQGLEIIAKLGGWPAAVALAKDEHERQLAASNPPRGK